MPLMLWLVMQAFGPFKPWRMPTWHSTLLGSVRSSHIGIHGVAQLAPEGLQIAVGRREQRQVVVLALIAAAAGADVDAGAVAELGRGGLVERVAIAP